MFPLFDQMQLQLGDVLSPAAVHTLVQILPDPVVSQVEVMIDRWPRSWSDEGLMFHGLTVAQSHMPY